MFLPDIGIIIIVFLARTSSVNRFKSIHLKLPFGATIYKKPHNCSIHHKQNEMLLEIKIKISSRRQKWNRAKCTRLERFIKASTKWH